jgi:uncharacterized membrane protein YkvA (DUF1232 family)
MLVAGIAAYALSPVDLIPDFIPVLGLVDDLLLLPLAIALAVRLIPTDVMAECRMRAASAFAGGRPVGWSAAVTVVLVWLGLLALGAVLTTRSKTCPSRRTWSTASSTSAPTAPGCSAPT